MLKHFFLNRFTGAWALAMAAFVTPALAAETQLQGGVFKQGGFIYGQTNPRAELQLLDTPIKVGADGRFFAGLHRYFPESGVLEVRYPDGTMREIPFEVTQRDYPTQHITGVRGKHVNPDPEQVARSRREAKAIRASRAPFSTLDAVFRGFDLPVKDVPETGIFGSRRTFNGEERSWHKGIDLAAPTGTPVHAPAEGVVTAAIPDTFFNGNLITIDHGYGLFTIYAHLDTMAVQAGRPVKEGEVIATVGNTGRSTGPHLHWGVYWHNVALDPKLFLRHTETKE